MTLPKRPPLNQPIPNANIPNGPEQYTVKAPYWDAVVSGDLTVTADGTLTLPGGIGSGDPDTQVQASWWGMPIGSGLTTNEQGFLVPNNYIYCTPAYPSLPPSDPPYGCETEVNTAGVTDFYEAWYQCEDLTQFPCVDSSSVTDFSYAWEYCYGLTSFPSINTSAGEDFTYSWAYTGLTSFPKLNTSKGSIFYGAWCGCYDLASFPDLDLSKGEDFTYAWYECESLTTFPRLDVSSGTDFSSAWFNCESLTTFPLLDVSSGTDFTGAWESCTSLTTFPAGMFDSCSATSFSSAWSNCALNQTSVNNILVSLDTAGQSNGTINLNGGTSSAPGVAGLAAKASLEGKGWTVSTN